MKKALVLAVLVLVLSVSFAHAQSFFTDQEPNNTVAQAQLLTGTQPYTINGTLTLGDVDMYLFHITSPGAAGWNISFTTIKWSAGSYTPANWVNWLNIRFLGLPGENAGSGTFGFPEPITPGLGTESASAGLTGFYLLQVWSTNPKSALNNPIIGSQVAGSYEIDDLQGIDGTIIGTVTSPEPSSHALLGMAALPVFGMMSRRGCGKEAKGR